MLGAIYIGMSGMDAYSKGLQTISNNVANLNTLGYKSTSVSFTDVFNYGGNGLSYSGGQGNDQTGNGVIFGKTQVNYKQGDLRQSNNDLDLAIQGNGFLVLMNDGKTYYARTGQFSVGEDGYITEQGTGYHLAVLDGNNQAVALNLDSKRTQAPVATTKITFADNLNGAAAAADVTSASATPSATVSGITVYDASGVSHTWQVNLYRVGDTSPGEWKVKVMEGNVQVGDIATLKFNGINFDPTTSDIVITGTSDLSVKLDFASVTDYQAASTSSTLRAASTDGNGVGSLTAVTIDENGQVKLTYSNTKTELAGAVALADFRDPQQLQRVSNGLFENHSSGQYRLRASGVDGVGKLLSKQVEASNVDLSQEFGDLILIQRGFQASSQVVSVANDMIQTLFGIRGQ